MNTCYLGRPRGVLEALGADIVTPAAFYRKFSRTRRLRCETIRVPLRDSMDEQRVVFAGLPLTAPPRRAITGEQVNNNNDRKRKSHPKVEAFTRPSRPQSAHDIAEAWIPCICRLVEAISPFAPRCAPHPACISSRTHCLIRHSPCTLPRIALNIN